MAVLGVYGAHATVLSADMMEFSADYPGCWERAVEQATGGMAVFLAGGVGSHSPVPGGRGLDGAEQMGQALARMVMDQVPKTALTNCGDLRHARPRRHYAAAERALERRRPASALAGGKARAGAEPQFPSSLPHRRLDLDLDPVRFQRGAGAGHQGFPASHGSSAVVTSFNGDYVGYVIPSRYYHLNGYEPRLMSFFGPNVPDYFDELIRSMSLALVNN